MFKLLLATDDPEALQAYGSINDWERLGFRPPRTASTADEATRLAIYKQIQIEINEQKPYVPMYVGVGNTGWRKGVSGIELAPDTKHDYSLIRCVEG